LHQKSPVTQWTAESIQEFHGLGLIMSFATEMNHVKVLSATPHFLYGFTPSPKVLGFK